MVTYPFNTQLIETVFDFIVCIVSSLTAESFQRKMSISRIQTLACGYSANVEFAASIILDKGEYYSRNTYSHSQQGQEKGKKCESKEGVPLR